MLLTQEYTSSSSAAAVEMRCVNIIELSQVTFSCRNILHESKLKPQTRSRTLANVFVVHIFLSATALFNYAYVGNTNVKAKVVAKA